MDCQLSAFQPDSSSHCAAISAIFTVFQGGAFFPDVQSFSDFSQGKQADTQKMIDMAGRTLIKIGIGYFLRRA